jgi:DnaK suppressor protein
LQKNRPFLILRNLKFYLSLLEQQKKELLENIDFFEQDLNILNTLEINDEGDYASISSEKFVETTLKEHQTKELKEILYAINKINNHSEKFGICEMCGDQISKERLKAKPQAFFCISCREKIEKSKT